MISVPKTARISGSQAGTTLIELMVVMAVLALIIGGANVYFGSVKMPLRTGGQLVEGLIKETRAKAATTMTVHRVRPLSDEQLIVEHAASCSAGTWTYDPAFDVELPDGVTLTDTSWMICFSNRGTALATQTLTLTHAEAGNQKLEVLMGGVVRWL